MLQPFLVGLTLMVFWAAAVFIAIFVALLPVYAVLAVVINFLWG
jgi:hypothetical protein